MSHLHDCVKVGYVVPWVTNALEIDSLCVVVDGLFEVFRFITCDKLGLDSESGKRDLQLIVGTSVEVGRADDVVARDCQSCNCHELSRLT